MKMNINLIHTNTHTQIIINGDELFKSTCSLSPLSLFIYVCYIMFTGSNEIMAIIIIIRDFFLLQPGWSSTNNNKHLSREKKTHQTLLLLAVKQKKNKVNPDIIQMCFLIIIMMMTCFLFWQRANHKHTYTQVTRNELPNNLELCISIHSWLKFKINQKTKTK